MPFHPGAILSVLSFALLIGVVFWWWSRGSSDPPGILAIKIILSSVLLVAAGASILLIHPIVGVPLGAVFGIVIGLLWGKNIGLMLARPLADLYDGGDEAPEARPFYAIAHAHRKQARYAEAVAEVERQLERFPQDVEGLLLLAEIHARNLRDWSEAEAAIEQIVENDALAVATRAKALQAVADWRLEAKDGPRARECFQRICDLFPNTPEANEAARRLGHASDDAWIEKRGKAAPLRIVTGDPRLGLRLAQPQAPSEPDPQVDIDALKRHLVIHPMDTEAREKLAWLYATGLGRPDWAIGELETVLAQPNHPPRLMARWLQMVADIHVRCGRNESEARTALGRIIQAFPDTALAAAAQSRLNHLKLELRAAEGTRALKPWQGES